MTAPTRPRRGRSEPLWDRIDRNRIKVAAFITLFVGSAALSLAIMVSMGAVLVGVMTIRATREPGIFDALPYLALGGFVLGAALAGVHVARVMSRPPQWFPGKFGAVPVQRGSLPVTESALLDMSIAVGRPCSPWLWLIEDCDRVNAFAAGLSEEGVVIGVTRGFIERLDADDQRAVFANLMAKVQSGDTRSATVLAAIMGPIWSQRASQFKNDTSYRSEPTWGEALTGGALAGSVARGAGRENPEGILGLFILGFFAVVLTEVLMAGHERAALAGSEKADAEGMLLLKDPAQMLTGLEKVLLADNTVPLAGEAYSGLFFCWAGFGYAPEDDPEMRRLGRLREVLGAAGA